MAIETLILGTVVCAVVAAGCVRFTVLSHDRVRRMRHRARFYLHPGPGFANHREITLHLGRVAALRHGRRSRQDLGFLAKASRGAHHYAVRLGRGPGYRRIFTHGEDQVAVISPPRTGKTGWLCDRIYDHPGAAVAVTTRADIYRWTSGKRALLGPVQVFNPAGVGNVPSTFRIDIVSECISPDIAMKTAASLAGPVDTGTDNAMWESLAQAALAGLLHVAAVLGRDIGTIWQWANRIGENEVKEALTRPDAAVDLVAAALGLQREGKTADSVRTILTRSLTWVANPAMLAMVAGPGLAMFGAAGWIESRGTIYFINDGADTSAEPLFRCIIEKIHRDCRMAGSRTSYGRIPNPVLFALDEVTQTCAVPLDQWLATSAGDGIQVVFVVHTPAQLRVRYGRDAADAIWQLAGTKVILSGNADPDLARAVAEVTGTTDDEKPEPVIPAAFLRKLPHLRALVIPKGLSPVVVKVRPIWRRPGHRMLFRPLARRLGLLHEPYVPWLWPPVAAVPEEITDLEPAA